MSVPKTTKVKLLNDRALKFVVQLLSWEGPKQYKFSKWELLSGKKKDVEDCEALAVLVTTYLNGMGFCEALLKHFCNAEHLKLFCISSKCRRRMPKWSKEPSMSS